MLLPAEGFAITEDRSYGDIAGQGKEIVADIVKLENAAIVPEVFDAFEVLTLMHGDGDRDPMLSREMIALRLVAMVVGVQNLVDRGDTQAGQVIEDCA